MAVAATDAHYLFLMRHAEHSEGHLTAQGSEHVRQTAARLGEWVQAEWRSEPDRRIRLWYTTDEDSEVLETVDLLTLRMSEVARSRGERSIERFSPHAGPDLPATDSLHVSRRARWMAARLPGPATNDQAPAIALAAYSPDEAAFRCLSRWLTSSRTGRTEARTEERDAPLLVGNDPLIGWLISDIVGRPLPVARGELVCLTRADRGWRLLWTISDDGPDEAAEVRAKIKSKMDAAAGLGTVIVALTTFLLQRGLEDQPTLFQWLAFAALASAAALYFASLFLYDSLQMPVRFWGTRFESPTRRGSPQSTWSRFRHGKPTVRRPPSSAARLLQSSMLSVWFWIFTPATFLAGIGVALYALSATPTGASIAFEVELAHVLAGLAVLVVSVSAWIAWHRPNLGASD